MEDIQSFAAAVNTQASKRRIERTPNWKCSTVFVCKEPFYSQRGTASESSA